MTGFGGPATLEVGELCHSLAGLSRWVWEEVVRNNQRQGAVKNFERDLCQKLQHIKK